MTKSHEENKISNAKCIIFVNINEMKWIAVHREKMDILLLWCNGMHACSDEYVRVVPNT